MGYQLFHLKIVPDDRLNADGRWIERVVPDTWPGENAQSHMLQTAPGFDYVPAAGFHVVEIREAAHGPSDQPGTMLEMSGRPIPKFDGKPQAPAETSGYGR